MGSANERRRYNVTSSLIDWAHTQNDPQHESNVMMTGPSIAVGLIDWHFTSWWRHANAFPSLAFCKENPPRESIDAGGFPNKRPVLKAIVSFWFKPDHFVEQTIDLPLIWDAPILKWRHCINASRSAREKLTQTWLSPWLPSREDVLNRHWADHKFDRIFKNLFSCQLNTVSLTRSRGISITYFSRFFSKRLRLKIETTKNSSGPFGSRWSLLDSIGY